MAPVGRRGGLRDCGAVGLLPSQSEALAGSGEKVAWVSSCWRARRAWCYGVLYGNAGQPDFVDSVTRAAVEVVGAVGGGSGVFAWMDYFMKGRIIRWRGIDE